jgi:hypothetical protein
MTLKAIVTKLLEKLTNVALNKKAFQSSTYGGRRRKYYSSAQAVDGLSKTFSMTNKVRRVNSYWYVDLGGIYTIRHIDIFNRRKSSGGYFSQFILVSARKYDKNTIQIYYSRSLVIF